MDHPGWTERNLVYGLWCANGEGRVEGAGAAHEGELHSRFGSTTLASFGSADDPMLGPDQPIEPSIWSSISLLHSTAYSMGSVRVTGSMNPLTTIPIACSSDNPRLIR